MKEFKFKITPFRLKVIGVIACWVLTFYPIFELTRCIITYNIIGGWNGRMGGEPLSTFYTELVLMWLNYLAFPFILIVITNLAVRWGKHHAQ